MRVWAWRIAAIVLVPLLQTPADAANKQAVVAATYDNFSVAPPTAASFYVCHGYGCKFRVEIELGPADHAALAQLMAAGKASPAAERAALGKAGAWFDKRIGAAAGTQRHIARADFTNMYDKGQFDCIDASRNTTTLLLVLDELKLLRHHEVDVPVARGHLFDGRLPHVTAVLVDKISGDKWAVDAWTVAYGQAPDILPLSLWLEQD